jgi:hypothetical protein
MIAPRRLLIAFIAWTVVAPAAGAAAQASTATISANVATLAKLTLSRSTASFPDADPDTVPQVAATGGAITITAKARARPATVVLLTVQASSDLRSGLNVIPATNVTWTATGSGFVAGTVSAVSPVTLASWTGSGIRTGTQSLFFRNLWTHPTGTYTVSLVYTLTSP